MAGTVPAQGVIENGVTVGSPGTIAFPVDPSVGSAVIAFVQDESETDIEFGGQAMTKIGTIASTGANNGYSIAYRILTGAENPSPALTVQNGATPSVPAGIVEYTSISAVAWVAGWDFDDPFFIADSTIPLDMVVTTNDGPTDCDVIAWANIINGLGGTTTVGTPALFTSLDTATQSSGSNREVARLAYQSTDDNNGLAVTFAVSHSGAGGAVTNGDAGAFGFTLTPAAGGDNPAQANTDFFFPYERLAVTAKDLPYYMDTGLLRGVFDE